MRRSGVLTFGRATGESVAHTVVLLAALAGLFAMHGMADHGTHHGAASGMTEAASVTHLASETPHSDLAVNARDSAPLSSPALNLSPAGDATQDAGGFAMTVCLAVLVGMVLVLYGRSRSRWFELGRTARSTLSQVLVARARAPDPPDLFVLSVQRC